jgi:hypothetical protein
MVVNASNHIKDRSLILGLQTANYVEVTKGIEMGDQVVVSDRSGLKTGQSR